LQKISLLKAIYSTVHLTEEIISEDISKHIQVAATKEKVLPIAILLMSGVYPTIDLSMQALNEEPIIRKIINRIKPS